MSLTSTILAAAETHHGNIAAETFVFGAVALVVFAVLGLMTFSFRDVANRHSGKAEEYAKAQLEHGQGH